MRRSKALRGVVVGGCVAIALVLVMASGALAAPEGIPETLGVTATGPTTAEVLGAVQLPAGTSYQPGADYALATEPWCTTHEGSPSFVAGGPALTGAGVRETFSARLEGLLPGHEYCAAAAVSVPLLGIANGERRTFTTGETFPTVTKVEPNQGPAGTTVTITGTEFIGATAVNFGSTRAKSFTVNSATSITVVSPKGRGTEDVTVTTVAGASATSAADQFTYSKK